MLRSLSSASLRIKAYDGVIKEKKDSQTRTLSPPQINLAHGISVESHWIKEQGPDSDPELDP
jgi:hypothetical protein